MSNVVQIQFRGLNEGDDPKSLPPGTLLVAKNCQMDKGRRLRKRGGTRGLVKTSFSGLNIAAGTKLITHGADTGLTDGQTLWTYSPPQGTWNPLDRPPALRITKRPMLDSTRSVVAVDTALFGDSLLVTLYQTQSGASALQMVTGGIYVRVDDLTTGRSIKAATTLAASGASYPRVLINDTTAILLFSDAGTIEYQLLDLATFTLGASGSLVVDARVANTVFDAVIGTPTGGDPTLYLAYELDTGSNRLKIASFDASTLVAVASAVIVGTDVRSVCLAFCDAAQQVVVAFSRTTSSATRLGTLPTNLASASVTTLDTLVADYVFVAEDDLTNVLVGWTRNDNNSGAADRLTTALYAITGHVQVATSERITFGLTGCSKPWRTAGRWYVAALTWVHPYAQPPIVSIQPPSSVVVEVETADSLSGAQDSTHPHVATLENQTGWYPPISQSPIGSDMNTFLVRPTIGTDGTVWFPTPQRDREPANMTDQVPVGWTLQRIATVGAGLFGSAGIGSATLCASGAPFWNDDASCMPYGFAHGPQIISVTAAAGGDIAVGVYSYVATYAWRDNNGVLHRSPPSVPYTGTSASSNNKLVVKVSTSSLSAKQRGLTAAQSANPVMIELWRTTVGGTSDHYRLTLEPQYGVFMNDPRAGDVSFTDTKADANIANTVAITLASRQVLYTETGELENVQPPPFTDICVHSSRIVGIASDELTVWLSKDFTIDSTVAPGFNEALTQGFVSRRTALARLDANLVVFGEDDIVLLTGRGPDEQGNSNDWLQHNLQSDVGCINPDSVAVGPAGVMFQSRRGIEQLSRKLTTDWVGKVIVDALAAFPVITSAVTCAAQYEIRFTCVSEDGLTGIVLAWDYVNSIWFTRAYNDASDTTADSIPFADAKLINGVYTLLTYGGQVYQELDTSWLDGEVTYVEQDIWFAPIESGGTISWGRIKDVTVMGTSVSDHDLTVSLAQDYKAYSQVKPFLAGGLTTAPGPRELCRVTVATQKCQAIQIRIQDTAPTGLDVASGQGPIIEGLAVRVTTKSGQVPKTAGSQQG